VALGEASEQVMGVEWLTEWLAKQTGMEYFHIDPLKINLLRHHRGDVECLRARLQGAAGRGEHARGVIATCEPYVKDWEKELKQMLRLEIKRVLASPLDISRYQVEFYNLAKSVKARSRRATSAAASATSSSWSRSARPTSSTTRTISTSSTWGLAVAVRLRPARERHPHGAAPRRRRGRFRIDGVLHPVYQIPMR